MQAHRHWQLDICGPDRYQLFAYLYLVWVVVFFAVINAIYLIMNILPKFFSETIWLPCMIILSFKLSVPPKERHIKLSYKVLWFCYNGIVERLCWISIFYPQFYLIRNELHIGLLPTIKYVLLETSRLCHKRNHKKEITIYGW